MKLSGIFRMVAATLFLVVAFVVFKFQFSQYFSMESRGMQAMLQMAGVELLFIGSSHSRFGYDLKLIERLSGERTFTLAYNNLTPVYAEVLLRWLSEDRKALPPKVVVEVFPQQMLRRHGLTDTRVFFDSPPDLKRKLAGAFLRHGGRWRDLYRHFVTRDNELFFASVLDRVYQASDSYRGSHLGFRFRPLDLPAFRETPLVSWPAPLDAEQVQALRAICRLLKLSESEVFFVDIPVAQPKPDAGVAKLKSQLAGLVKEEGCSYLDPTLSAAFDPADPALFRDPGHLSVEGRAVLTRWLVKQVYSRGSSGSMGKAADAKLF